MSNIFPGELVAPVSDTTVSVVPTLSLDRTTPRQSEKLTYSPSFIFYQPTSVLDTVDQSASFGFQDRLTQQLTVNLQESFLRTSNVFDESYIYSQGGVSGSAQTQAAEVIFPFAEQWDNMVHGIADYQFGRDAMAGGGGSFTLSDFPSSTNSAGAFNSHSSGGLAFFSERPTHNQVSGVCLPIRTNHRRIVNCRRRNAKPLVPAVLHVLFHAHIFIFRFRRTGARCSDPDSIGKHQLLVAHGYS